MKGPSVVIIGSGPSGFYTAESICKKINSDIDYLTKRLKEATKKQSDYEIKNIAYIIDKVSQKETLISEKEAKTEEKNLLTSKFSEINLKYEALLKQVQNQLKEFENEKNAKKNSIISKFEEKKLSVYETYRKIINEIKTTYKEEKEVAKNELNLLIENENSVKRRKAEFKHQVFFKDEINKCNALKTQLETKISKAKLNISKSKNESNNYSIFSV